jgi:DNA-binding NarL/FixJ family response regulator
MRNSTVPNAVSAPAAARLDKRTSPAEREVGLLLLKGLSHKEIAGVLDKSERTVRQQSLGIYKKAGLAGRAELSAFFLEDLLLPS